MFARATIEFLMFG